MSHEKSGIATSVTDNVRPSLSPKRTPITKTDELDILSAVWILSCNDDNPIMTYQGISDRLNLPEGFDVKALVAGRRELFRTGLLESRLTGWKQEMRAGSHRPGWMVKISDESDRLRAIESLSTQDVFRNQFRAAINAPRCSIEIINWGLEHIERLRKGWSEERDERNRRIGTIVIPLLSLVLAFASVAITGLVQLKSINSQESLKHYEVTFKPKQEAYSSFMDELALVFLASDVGDKKDALEHVAKMEAAYYKMEPFLSESVRRESYRKFTDFNNACVERMKNQTASDDTFVAKIADLKKYFRSGLYSALFADASLSN